MKRATILSLFALTLLLSTRETAAQNAVDNSAAYDKAIGANVGYDIDADRVFAGAQFRFAPSAFPIIINPSIETFFVDGLTWWHFDLNALYPFGVDNTTFTPYAGAGLGLDYIKVDNFDGNTDAGLNLLFGANLGMGRIQPFGETRIRVGDGIGVAVRGGLLFGI
jgi:hypothetical protein